MLSKSLRNGLCVVVVCVLMLGCSSSFAPVQSPTNGQSATGESKAAATLMAPEMSTVPVDASGLTMNTPFITPGLVCPEMFSIDEVTIPDDTEIIGIVEGEESMAYVCSAMAAPASHVINDFLLRLPVSVTYCDRTDCVRVFSGVESGKPLELQLGGFMNGGMAVRLNDVMYPQSSDKIPLKDHEFTRAKWSEWKVDYPATKVYVGNKK